MYVPNLQSNDVYVIDPATFEVVDKFKVGLNPQHVVPSYDLRTLWVANNAENTKRGSLTPVDPKTGKPGKAIAVDDPYNMYFSPDGKSAIVVAEAMKRLDFRDPQTMQLQYSIDVPRCAGINHADFSIDGAFAIFTCEFTGTVAKIDLVHRKVLGYTQVIQPGRPTKIVKGPDGKDEVICTTWKGMPQDIRASPDGKIFFVADMMADGVHVVDGETFRQIGFIETGKGTHGLYPSRDGKKLYVANRGSNKIHGAAEGQGQRVGHRFRDAQGRGELADSGRRQPRHGQRQRGRQDALALGPLRQRRLRDRHGQRRGEDHPGRTGAARAHGLAAAGPLLARAHGQPALGFLRQLRGVQDDCAAGSSVHRSARRSNWRLPEACLRAQRLVRDSRPPRRPIVGSQRVASPTARRYGLRRVRSSARRRCLASATADCLMDRPMRRHGENACAAVHVAR